LRTSDIDNVGLTNRHLTFFEMLGNWSFGDYFKKEAIEWSFEFLTDEKWLNLDKNRLYVTVFKGEGNIPKDEESIAVWQNVFEKAGIKAEIAGEDEIIKDNIRIISLGTEDNFWIAGKTGPCGGDTEMFYDTRPDEPARNASHSDAGGGKINGKFSHLKEAQNGDYIVVVGGRVGLDGIHGATFSSVAMDSNSPATAVQIGDPITQKKLSDAIIKEARDMNLYTSITDNGAGGISCSVAEMAKECGGAEVDLEKVPLKYPGLRPWEIWISESQERMTLSVPKEKWEKFNELMRSRGVEATVIGKFTNSGKCIVKYKGKKIMDIDMEFLHNGLPKHQLITAQQDTPPFNPSPKERERNTTYTQALENLLGDKNISSFSFISEQYDHEVQASSVLKPLSGRGRINTDAQVFRPVLNSNKGAIVSASLYPSYGDISTYHMAACAIDTAIRNAISAGGKLSYLAILDNFCWCSSYDQKRLSQLVESLKACYEYAVGYGTPFISGKDSMFNDFKGYDEKGNPVAISIPPTLLISVIGVIDNLYKTVSPEFKNSGDIIYLLGETNDELGGGEYLKMLGAIGNSVPKVNLEKNIKTYSALEKAIETELVASAISVNSGGLGITLAKACLGGMVGCNVSIKNLPGNAKKINEKLFAESQGRILVSVSSKNVSAFEKLIKNISHAKLGKVTKDEKVIVTDKTKVVETNVKKLHKIYHSFSEKMK